MIGTITKVMVNKLEINIICRMEDISLLNSMMQIDSQILVEDLLKKLIDIIILFLGFNLYYII